MSSRSLIGQLSEMSFENIKIKIKQTDKIIIDSDFCSLI